MPNLSPDIFWLTLTILLTALFWVPYIINRMYEHGVWPALYNPQPDTRPKAEWAERMMRAHENAIENLIIFAPLVLIIEILSLNSYTTGVLCTTYFFARLFHFILYSLKVPLFRTVAFLLGFFCQASVALIILKFI
jgi:uncharacterized MAPEG superfamily protein